MNRKNLHIFSNIHEENKDNSSEKRRQLPVLDSQLHQKVVPLEVTPNADTHLSYFQIFAGLQAAEVEIKYGDMTHFK